jgi:outer membrane protein OmpA-like peptidoglycan-associated protein
MLKTLKTYTVRASGIMAVLALAACGNLSQVSDKGTTDEPVWPDPADTSFDTGSYPAVENLRLVGPGMSKDQLYNLLGRPHFAEGLAGVREWDYLFHFRTANGDLTCQYKVLFDKDKLARSFLWKPEACADLLNPRQPAAPSSYSLNSDVLFAFGSAVLTAAGQAEVARVAAQLEQHGDATVTVVGHTDRIGSDAANMALSQRRAQSVRDALVSNGVAASSIRAVGAGESQPVVQCGEGSRNEVVACLAPNRRVEIAVQKRG